MTEPLKPLDEKIVAALCRDGRADIRDLAAAADAAPTTVQKRLRVLKENGVIGGHTASIDYDRLGYETVIFRLSVELDVIDDVTERLREQTSFVTVYQMSGPDAVFAVGKFGTESAVSTCVVELHEDPDIRRIETDRVRSVRREGSSPLVGE